MAVVTPLIDTLLASRLAQRLDLVPLKGQSEVPEAQPASAVDRVTNEVRLPSRAALGQLAGQPAATHRDAARGATADAAAAVTLGAAARAIDAVLGAQAGAAPAVPGAGPLWSSNLPPPAPLLAQALARAVTTSGLFYESHLQQYASGTRPLTDLQEEPQARLAFATAATDAVNVTMRSHAPAPHTPAPADGLFPRMPDPATAPELRAGGPDDGPAPASGDSSPGPAHRVAGAAAAIHPDAVTLVHQQLDLLELGVFRWSGEAWPGARMDWEIRKEPEHGEPMAEQGVESAWSTTLQVSLPALGAVEVKLSLGAAGVQARLLAQTGSAARCLSDGRDGLAQRLGASGLPLLSCEVLANDFRAGAAG